MERDLLSHLFVVAAVARRKGFAAAAGELGMSPSAVSHAVRVVEERLGQAIFARTTRSVALTEAGEAFLAGISPVLADIAEEIERLQAAKGRAGGVLRLNAPRLALPLALTRILKEMVELHPDVTVDITVDEGLADIVGEGFDAGVRLGEMIARDMVAVRLTPPFKAILVASPHYLARRGRPERIADLASHHCIGFRRIRSRALYRWELSENGKDVAVETRGPLVVSDAMSALDLAREGLGIAYLFEPLVCADIAEGRLEQLLSQTAIEEPGLFLYFPSRASLSPKLRAFIDTARRVQRQAPDDVSSVSASRP
ncbi:LysR family transcriptional regulator [Afifella marina]|nr:LysR family transcriptional regulator [Afifella marina]MBK1624185.1 LysR family transcriptional regulator [Afifella marina DSM 2698]MBK1627918.1 LysR family transcriptional regulator [Afifella marina]MBK5918112.1 LysR family transcriptional regulator [Afifella marina]RAI19311.1 LysR family transcriptional regulator [Afifella marina DSM 2698]